MNVNEDDFQALEQFAAIGAADHVLHVDIDALALLDHFDDDEAKTFDFLAKLRDLLA